MTLAGLSKRPGYAIYHGIWKAVDWLYPPHCGGCDLPGERYCRSCLANTVLPGENICRYCGTPLQPEHNCPTCENTPSVCEQIRSWGIFTGPLRNAIHALKYRRDLGLSEYFSQHLVEALIRLKWSFDVVTAVPLSNSRMRSRGYNQSAMLAKPVALAFDKPFLPGAVHRQRETRSQVGLSISERFENVNGAFNAQGRLVRGKIILLIDDVTTTGATIQACAQALKSAGASSVFGLTLARTAHPSSQADGITVDLIP